METNLKEERERISPLIKEVYQCIGLMNSMILSGEQHNIHSIMVQDNAKAALDSILNGPSEDE